VAEQLLVSLEGCCSIELVTSSVEQREWGAMTGPCERGSEPWC